MSLRLGVSSGQQAIEDRIEEELASLITQVTNEITWHMRERDLTRADLAGLMGVSPGRVSQVLSGGENLTLRTLASLAAALDVRFEVALSSRETTAPEADDTDYGMVDIDGAMADDFSSLPRADRLEEASALVIPTTH